MNFEDIKNKVLKLINSDHSKKTKILSNEAVSEESAHCMWLY